MRRVDPTGGDAYLDGRGRSRLAAPTAGAPSHLPGCEPRSRWSRADQRRLQPRIRTLDPHVADPPSLRSCRCGSSPSPRACRRPRHAGSDAVSVSPGCGPLRRRLGGRSHPDIDRAPAGSRPAPACVQPPAAADPTEPPATASPRPEVRPPLPLVDALLPRGHSPDLSANPDPRPRPLLSATVLTAAGRRSPEPALTSHSADVTTTYQPEQGGRFECRPGVTFPADSHCTLALSIMLAMALGRIAAGQREHLRSLTKSA